MIAVFSKENFKICCDQVARKDKDLAIVLRQYGYPPLWSRSASFGTLIHIILEQQVSLASAKAALNKLKDKIGRLTPKKILALSDTELKSCFFSRQKIIYARHLAAAILSRELDLKKLSVYPEEIIRAKLKAIKGIGDWTVDVFLLMALHRNDVFPVGDLALVNSIKQVKLLHPHTSKPEILKLAESWRPYRSIATMLLWHAYLSKRKWGRA
jgi:DNA-3-methyladenine glycosylase II